MTFVQSSSQTEAGVSAARIKATILNNTTNSLATDIDISNAKSEKEESVGDKDRTAALLAKLAEQAVFYRTQINAATN